MRFRFVEDRRADYPVRILCDVLGVSPAGYYAWRSRPESRRSAANRDLVDDIQQVHREAYGRYGSPRIHAELRAAFPAQWLNGCFAFSPVRRAFWPPSSAQCASIVTDLIPASGYRDHAT
jgi:hypothetical protein